jgi:hypothetical protein
LGRIKKWKHQSSRASYLKHFLSGCVLIYSSLVALPSSAMTIDFEALATQNFGPSTVIDGVTFSIASPSSSPQVRVFNASGDSRTAYILGCEIPGAGCVEELGVDFGQPVTNLNFDIVADGVSSGSGFVFAFLNNVFVGGASLIGDGNGLTHDLVSLAALGAIDRLILNPTLDPFGIGYDNFSFDLLSVSATATASVVPLPAAVWLFGSASTGLAGFSRRRTPATA